MTVASALAILGLILFVITGSPFFLITSMLLISLSVMAMLTKEAIKEQNEKEAKMLNKDCPPHIWQKNESGDLSCNKCKTEIKNG